MKIFAIMYPTPFSLSHALKNAQKIKKTLFVFTKRTRQFFKSKEVLMLLAVHNKSGKWTTDNFSRHGVQSDK